jgi:peptidoglycan/LPS O-acetylase OafA/YrhL
VTHERPSTPRKLGQVPSLDGYRAVAVILVLIHHIAAVLVPGVPTLAPDGLIPGGFLGVDLFFVLSGFLITALLLGERRSTGRISLGSFYQRRAVRLLPALYTFIALHALYAWITGLSMRAEWASARAGVLYVTNWYGLWRSSPRPAFSGHFWTLAIEAQFYVVWPLVLILFDRLKARRVVPWLVVVTIVLIGIRRWVLFSDGANVLFVYTGTLTRSDALLIGVLLAYLWSNRLLPKRGLSAAATVAMLVFAVIVAKVGWNDPWLYQGGFTLVALCAAVMLAALAEKQWWLGPILALRPLRAIGRVSYGIYIWHLPIFVAVDRIGGDWTVLARVALGLAGTALASVASWFLVERRFLRMKMRPKPVTAAPTPA